MNKEDKKLKEAIEKAKKEKDSEKRETLARILEEHGAIRDAKEVREGTK